MTTTTGQRQTVVLDLATLNAAMLPEVGGKAANLGELIRAGLPVPGGFCVTTRGYRQAVAGTELDILLDELAQADPTEVSVLTALAERARAQLIAAGMPDTVADAIAEAYD